jgi:acetolactate synthase I/II/III large subunit
VRKAIDPDTVLLSEGITSYPAISDHIDRTRPLTYFASGGGSLGWNGGAAVGMKLAAPEKTFVASTVHWMARHYRAPFLQVVYNNRGWKAPKYSTLAVHPDGSQAAPATSTSASTRRPTTPASQRRRAAPSCAR